MGSDARSKVMCSVSDASFANRLRIPRGYFGTCLTQDLAEESCQHPAKPSPADGILGAGVGRSFGIVSTLNSQFS
jgi:hypothetical protein